MHVFLLWALMTPRIALAIELGDGLTRLTITNHIDYQSSFRVEIEMQRI